MPDACDLYNPAVGIPDQYGEIQQLAIRVYNLNRAYHPHGDETFFDSFLMLSEKTGVLLMTLKVDAVSISFADFFTEDFVPQVDLIPLYNVSGQDDVEVGGGWRPFVIAVMRKSTKAGTMQRIARNVCVFNTRLARFPEAIATTTFFWDFVCRAMRRF